MRIAFVSYEYPPDTAFGGIATYVRQAARMLAHRGHEVEVFTASPNRQGTEELDQVTVHRIQISDRRQFAQDIAPIFAERHLAIPFDVLEGPDFGADAAVIAAEFPALPLVLKLHTPSYVLNQIGFIPPTALTQARFMLGALRRGRWPQMIATKPYNREADPEYYHSLQAKVIAAPSQAIAARVQADWQLDANKIYAVPYPYIPTPDLTQIPIETNTQRISFLGRLEIRKGILDLVEAIPEVLQQYPTATFRFIGPAWPSPKAHLDMQAYIGEKLKRYQDSIEFTGAVPLDTIPHYLAQTDICVFPSIWESFGLVCLEAMSAGRGVIASHAGGMAELLDQGNAGLLIPPKQPGQLAAAMIKLLRHPELRQHYGRTSRARVLEHYNLDGIAQLQESCYQQAIAQQVMTQSSHPLISLTP
jgi:glycosyltransferase involved in cell wall biosynthesis